MKENQKCENSFFSKPKSSPQLEMYGNRCLILIGGKKQKETSSSSSLSLSTIVIPFFFTLMLEMPEIFLYFFLLFNVEKRQSIKIYCE